MKDHAGKEYNLKSPILFLLFNRPNLTALSFKKIRDAKPSKLYISVDGPRKEKKDDIKKISEVKKIISYVDWPCEVKTLFQKKNLGCRYAVSEALTWFFKNEEKGIIMEDDNLPNDDFFIYCDELLNYYQNDNRVLTISGDNWFKGKKYSEESYHFSKYFIGWGWATWRRTWELYDQNMSFWPKWKKSDEWKKMFPDKVEKRYWEKKFDSVSEKNFNSMAYVFTASLWFYSKDGLNITPSVNLVTNIGHGVDATHTTSLDGRAKIGVEKLNKIIHPKTFKQNKKADEDLFNEHYGGRYLRMPFILINFPVRVIRYLIRKIKF